MSNNEVQNSSVQSIGEGAEADADSSVLNYDEMESGRILDALVAEKVMGFKWVTPNPAHAMNQSFTKPLPRMLAAPDTPTNVGSYFALADMAQPLYDMWFDGAPCYSADIGDAWQVVERLRSLGFDVQINARSGYNCAAFAWPMGTDFDSAAMCFGDAPKAPLAICRAALKAIASQSPVSPPG